MTDDQSPGRHATPSDLLRRAQDLELDSETKFGFEVHEAVDEMQSLRQTNRRPWLEDVVLELLADQGGRCALCDGKLEFGAHEIDHIVPFVYRGGNERANIQVVHPQCNRSKGDEVAPRVLLQHLEDLYMNR